MQTVLAFTIFLGLTIYSSVVKSGYVSSQKIDWSSYGYKEIIRDMKSFLNHSDVYVFELTMRRYPGIIAVFRSTLAQITADGNFNENLLCHQMYLVIIGMNDSCKRSQIEISRDVNLTEACNETIYASLIDQKLSRLCQADIYMANGTHFSGPQGSGSFFDAIKLLTGTASEATRRWCNAIGGTFKKQGFVCIKNGTVIKINPIRDESLRKTVTVGNCISLIALTFLLVTYAKFKKYDALAGKNIMCLSTALLVAHFLLIIVDYLYDNEWVCRAGGVILHFALLLAFSWMAIIAFEFYHTFSKVRPIDKFERKKRSRKYVVTSFTVSVVILFICLMIDIPEERYSGYGLNRKCFISKFWANLIAFVIPVASVLIFNVTLLSLTIWSLRKLMRSTAKSLRLSANTTAKKQKMTLSIMALKLSILLGLGWICGFIEASCESKALTYIYSIIVSLQGFFVFVAFGCHKECWGLIKQKNEAETHVTYVEMNTI